MSTPLVGMRLQCKRWPVEQPLRRSGSPAGSSHCRIHVFFVLSSSQEREGQPHCSYALGCVFVIKLDGLLDRDLSVLLRGGEVRVAEPFLDGTPVGAFGPR